MENFLKSTVERAGKLALSYQDKIEKGVKSDGSIVTSADIAVEQFIRDKILTRYSTSSFLGEETRFSKGDGLLWVVDPIDGTSVFASGCPMWTISIAVFENNRPLAAIVYAPKLGEMYHAFCGAYYYDRSPARPRPFFPSKEAFLFVPSDFHQLFRSRFDGKVRNFGSACLHSAYVFAGRADAVVATGHLWDLAAGFVFAAATGGSVTKITGEPITWGQIVNIGKKRANSPLLFASSEKSAEFFSGRIIYLQDNDR